MEVSDFFNQLAILIIASILSIIFKDFYDTRNFNWVKKNRKKALEGNWSGTFSQDNIENGDIATGIVIGTLKVRSKRVKGQMRIDNQVHQTTPWFNLRGGIKNERFLVLDYENEKNEVVQFGKLILELSAKADTLSGMFVSYGAESQNILKGNVELKKEK